MLMIHEKQRGLLFVMVGPGGTGKNTLMNVIKGRHSQIKQLATATTRPPRPGEQHGREHFFVSQTEFQQMIDNRQLLEYQEVTPGKFYGIPRFSVEDYLEQGQHLIADIEVYGAQILQDNYPDDAILIFVTVPGQTLEEQLAVLRERMLGREESSLSETEIRLIEYRLERAKSLELPFQSQCDYVIVNDDFERALEELDTLIQKKIAERKRLYGTDEA